MKKTLFILLLAVALLLSGCGCQRDPQAADPGTEQSSAQPAEAEENGETREAAEPQESAELPEKDAGETPEDLEALLASALEEKDVQKILALLNDHPELGDALVEKVKEACAALDYDAFLFLDELIGALPEGDCKDALTQYAEESQITRLQAFLNGTWAWYYDQAMKPIVVELTVTPDGTGSGIVKQAGGHLARYRFAAGDVYWKDFEYQSGNAFTCYNLTKNGYGTVFGANASATVDFENEVLHMHLTSDSLKVNDEDRDWVRFTGTLDTPTASESAGGGAEEGKEMILATGDQKYIQLPDEASYLPEFKTKYAYNTIYIGPCTTVERYPMRRSGGAMPFAYEGTKVTVVAEQNDMSCIIYRDSDNRIRAGWIWSTDLLDEFSGKEYRIGEHIEGSSTIPDVQMAWSRKGFLGSQQNYSVLAEPVENCVGFTLEYQLIQENTRKWHKILGPRTIYVYNGEEWIDVGSFEYPEFGPVRIEVNLDEPMDIVAVGTIAKCDQPNLFRFRQYAFDYRIA